MNNKLSKEVIDFIEWIAIHDEWHYAYVEDVWKQYGYRNRNTQQLFEYYLKIRPKQ
jgi:hypothetical protein